MDIASLIGVVLGTAIMGYVFFEASHGHFSMFYSEEGVLMVIGGSISVVFMSLPLERVKAVFGYMRRFMFNKGRTPTEVIKLITILADKARREGILSLESEYDSVKTTDPFLAAAMRMAIDGVEAGNVEMTMRMEILAMQDRHKAGKKFFDLIKLYGPGWGLVGTLVGQIGMFGQLGGSVEAMGHSLAVAVCATMYGTVAANAIAGPIGDKLALRSSEEILNREMILQGILSIQSGDNPRITVDKMLAFLPTPARDKLRAAA